MYKIAHWDEYQHYGDKKRVPWIKLHFRILTSESWMMLDDSHRCLMITCMLHASENNGKILKSLDYMKNLGRITGKVSFKSLIDIGFLESLDSVYTESREIQNDSIIDKIREEKIREDEEGGLALTPNPYTPTFEFLNSENWKSIPAKFILKLDPKFEIPEEWGTDMEALGWKYEDIVIQAEKFRQYWVSGNGAGKRRSARGWRQSWSTWMTKAAEWRK